MYLPTCLHTQVADTRSIFFFEWSLTGLNSEYSFSSTGCHAKIKEPSLLYYLPLARGRTVGFIPFMRVLVLCEILTASSRIWTWVSISICYAHKHYTTSSSKISHDVGNFNVCMDMETYRNLCLFRQKPHMQMFISVVQLTNGLQFNILSDTWIKEKLSD